MVSRSSKTRSPELNRAVQVALGESNSGTGIAPLLFSPPITVAGTVPGTPIGSAPIIDITWTTVPMLQQGDVIVYCDDTAGNDGNSGLTEALPKKTLAAAVALIRDGFGDRLYLKCGSTWTDQIISLDWRKGGPSAARPIIIGSYGTGPRPKIITPGSECFFSSNLTSQGIPVKNVWLLGLEMYPSAVYDGSYNINGVTFQSQQWSNVLIEDCYIHGFSYGIVAMGVNVPQTYEWAGMATNFALRGSIIYGCFRNNGQVVAGIYTYNIDGQLIEWNTFDTNGWIADGQQSVYRRNAYIDNVNRNVVVQDNLFFGTDGIQMRCGETLVRNVFVRAITAIILGAGTPPINPGGVLVTCEDNTIIEGKDATVGGESCQGIVINNVKGGTVRRNIIANSLSPTGTTRAFMFWKHDVTDTLVCKNTDVSNNIAHNWGGNGLYLDDAPASFWGGVTFTNNVMQNPDNSLFYGPELGAVVICWQPLKAVDFLSAGNVYRLAMGATNYSRIAYQDNPPGDLSVWKNGIQDSSSTSNLVTYARPNRSTASYYASIGGSSNHDALALDIRTNQRKNNWRQALTASAINLYLKAGFQVV